MFADYMIDWLESIKHAVAETTYYGYKLVIENHIVPYFRKKGLELMSLRPHHIQSYYLHKMENGISAKTVHRHHANIHKALKDAHELEYIRDNPASKVRMPKTEVYRGSFYTPDELRKLIRTTKETRYEVPVMIASWFGMRRGEIIGLKWEAINLNAKALHMYGTVIDMGTEDGLSYRPFGKTSSSIRTFPLSDDMVEYFQNLKKRQQENKKLAGNSYNMDWIEYVCVDDVGNIIRPGYLSSNFAKFLESVGLRKIRFHDLRHTNASLLLDGGASLKEIQDWLGHKKFSTTADVYAHTLSGAKQGLSNTISSIITN
jgi:integrase